MGTPADAQRAYRLRHRSSEGMSKADAKWLAQYTKDVSSRARRKPWSAQSEPAPAPAPSSRAEDDEIPIPSEKARKDSGWVPPDPEEDEADDAPADGPAQTSSSPVDAAACQIPNCPACKVKAQPGSLVCVATGERVWRPMSRAGARGFAVALLAIVGVVVRVLVGGTRTVQPTAEEVEGLADALLEIAQRRAAWMGAIDDLVSAAYRFGAYGRRAYVETKKQKAAALAEPSTTEAANAVA